MFGKKYVFETHRTKTIRHLKNCILFLLVTFLFYLGTGVAFVLIAENEDKLASQSLYNRPPDLIVIFTGAKGRIPFGIKKAKLYAQSKVFITGVYSKNSVATLIDPLRNSDGINSDLLEIDYLARNTVENAIATVRHLRKNNALKRVLFISHDYHITRVRMIVNSIVKLDEEEKIEFYFSSIKTDYTKPNNLKILYKEVYKFIRAAIFVIMWESGREFIPSS